MEGPAPKEFCGGRIVSWGAESHLVRVCRVAETRGIHIQINPLKKLSKKPDPWECCGAEIFFPEPPRRTWVGVCVEVARAEDRLAEGLCQCAEELPTEDLGLRSEGVNGV